MEIQDIKTRLTLSQVLQHYGLRPDKNLRLHCPFHEDKTPSLQVYYKTHTSYCFSSNCKTHGKRMDVVRFVWHKENYDQLPEKEGWHKAIVKCVEIIEYYQGKVEHQQKPIPIGSITRQTAQLSMPREQFLQNIFTYFKNAIPNSRPAQQYLQSRGLFSSATGIKGGLEIGYNSSQFHHGPRRDEVLINNCVAVGLLSPWGANNRKPEEQSYKGFGKECIVFALRNKANQVSGLYFRSIINNDNERHYYLKDSTGLYPGYPKPETEKLIITESIIDAASLLQIESIAKQYNILAAYGTNRLNDEMKAAIIELKQLQEIVFAFDNDDAGNKAAVKYKEELAALLPGVTISKIVLPPNGRGGLCKDVNETLTAHNDQVFTPLLQERTTDFFFSSEKENTEYSETIPEPGAKLLVESSIEREKIAELKQQHPTHELNTDNPYKLRYTTDTANYYIQGGLPKTTDNMKIMLVIEQLSSGGGVGGGLKARNRIDLYEDKQVERLCKEVSEKLSLRKDLLEADLYRLTDLLEKYIESQMESAKAPPPEGLGRPLTIKERTELEAFAKKPKLIKRLNELLGQAGIVGEERNRIFLLIIAISHKMPETLHALIQGSSGSGKTRLLKQISDCVPKESVTKLTRLSDKALYNFPEYYFVNHLLCLEDIDGLSEEAELSFRELQSNGELNSATSIKLENGQMTGGQKRVRGPIASMACTTRGEVYEDNMSRVFLIAVDESTEQTKKIIEYQNCVAAGAINREDERKVKLFLQKFISIIQAREVINPFAQKIQLPEEAHKIRRLNDLFQSFVKMITVLNQYQRKSDDRKRLITEIEDIETAVAVMFESIVLKVDELDGSLRQFYERLKAYLKQHYNGHRKTSEFTLREIRQALNASKMQVFRYFNDLQQLEYVKQNGGYANRGFTYKILYWDDYGALRERIKTKLYDQLNTLKEQKE
jgi:DNA primase